MTPIQVAIVAAVPTLVADLVSKHLVYQHLESIASRRVVVIPGFFNLVEVWNTGVSFGMLGGSGMPPILLIAVSLAICLGLGWWVWRGIGRWPAAGVGLVIGGAVGNVVDRVRWGSVFDFADFHVGSWHWPAFNIADSAIVVGVGLLLIDSLFFDKQRAA